MKTTNFFMKDLNPHQKRIYFTSIGLYGIVYLVVHIIRGFNHDFLVGILLTIASIGLFADVVSFILVRKVIINNFIIESEWKYPAFVVALILSIVALFY